MTVDYPKAGVLRPSIGVAWLVPVILACAVPGDWCNSSLLAAHYTHGTALRLAYSDDGVSFLKNDRTFCRHASAPSMIALPDGELLAVANVSIISRNGDDTGVITLASTRSTDGGRSWSKFRPLEIDTESARTPRRRRGRSRREAAAISGTNAQLARLPDGRILLFFHDVDSGRRRRGSRGGVSLVRTAISDDGLHFVLQEDPRFPARVSRSGLGVSPVSVWHKGELHLFIHEPGLRKGRRLQHLVSRNGEAFDRDKALVPRGIDFVGSVAPWLNASDRLRAYVSTSRGVASLVSADGSRWRKENGMRIADAWDSAVVTLPEGGYLAMFCERLGESDGSHAAMLESSLTADIFADAGGSLFAADDAERDEAPWQVADPADGNGQSVDDGSDDESATVVAVAPDDIGPAESPEEETASAQDSSQESDASGSGQSSASISMVPVADIDGFVPIPDFDTRLDYFTWFKTDVLGNPSDNAYLAYDKFFNNPWDAPGSKAEPPTMRDMFHDGIDGPPGPWDPLENPDWERSYQAMTGWIDQFRKASRHRNYAIVMDEDYLAHMTTSDGHRLLIGILLPSLGQHRSMIRSTLAGAWRVEGDKVSPDAMRDAVTTSLRSANHLNQGATLIEQLVGLAVRGMAYHNARWALKRGFFAGNEVPGMMEAMRSTDDGLQDSRRAIRGEHAMTMDLIQGAFWPKTSGAEPRLRDDVIPEWQPQDEFDNIKEQMNEFSREDLRRALRDFDQYYRELSEMMAVGYPDVREQDIDELAAQFVERNPLTSNFLPSLGRVHYLRTRYEAERRGTLASFAAHDFRERHGRWPETMAEIGEAYGYDIATDPFTGLDYGYEVTEDGPRIYSYGENGVDDGGHGRGTGSRRGGTGEDDLLYWPPPHR